MTNDELQMNDEARSPNGNIDILSLFDHWTSSRHASLMLGYFAHKVRDHICSITLSPNCEHLISVAPSIKRAKSYVPRLLAIAPLNPLRTRSAASVQPM